MRLTEEEKYWISQLESQKILHDQDIADILLVWSRFKPAALITLMCDVAMPRKEFRKSVQELRTILEHLKFSYRLRLNYPKDPHTSLTRFSFIASDKTTLKKLIAAQEERNVENRRMLTGTLLGYPSTAVVAFSKSESLRTWPKLSSHLYRFLNFRFSKKWRKELPYVRRRASEIKKISPELYRRIRGK